jgi:competence protein ComGC
MEITTFTFVYLVIYVMILTIVCMIKINELEERIKKIEDKEKRNEKRG